MQAQRIAFFIFAFVLATGIINGSGIFDTQVPTETVTLPNSANLSTGVTDISNGVLDETDAANSFDGWAVVGSMTSALMDMLSVLVLPGKILVNYGFPVAVALAVQAMVNLTELAAIIQFVSNRSFQGME